MSQSVNILIAAKPSFEAREEGRKTVLWPLLSDSQKNIHKQSVTAKDQVSFSHVITSLNKFTKTFFFETVFLWRLQQLH
jgi:hypothetical protein